MRRSMGMDACGRGVRPSRDGGGGTEVAREWEYERVLATWTRPSW